ncbi:MAG: pyruvate, phosphate dikinase [Promethearchaeota archaeon]|nr:MAG: pyruvate, phosphate dikinase [Candidatus Lokiarchaeota archaeon]
MDQSANLTFSSGIPALDQLLQNVLAGDNVVFQVENIDEYIPFVQAFISHCNAQNLDLVYFRFAQHPYLMPESAHATLYQLYPEKGFDYFISEIISIIEKRGLGTCYIFDSLSDLAVDWYSNIMLGNLFMLICPYLHQFKTVAYFALFRHRHDSETFNNIHETAQVVIDVYRDEHNFLFIHPLKVFKRFSSTIFMLHKWLDVKNPTSSFQTIKESAKIAEILTKKHYQWLDITKEYVDAWHLSFQEAQKTLEGLLLGEISLKETVLFKSKLLRKAIVQDDLQSLLALKYFDIEDILQIRKRMIGTGFIGGKSYGMLLARAILSKEVPELCKRLEQHDSFYIGTEVYYTFLVKNDCWWMRRRLSNPATFLDGWRETREKILRGSFPESLVEKFKEVLNYFGQAPIIVRSSSLQEDAYGNSFSGKYESVFVVNQGNPEERLEGFLDAIRTVYASTVSPNALSYRKDRGLLEDDEQMAILVQRVSGSIYGDFFFPQIAGTGFSFNPFVWHDQIDPKAGFLRLVFGLGTRAVERIEDDYTRLVALNEPTLRVESSIQEIEQHSQRKVDLLDIRHNQLVTKDFIDLKFLADSLPLSIVATYNHELEQRMQQLKRENVFPWILTFNNLLKNSDFITDMRTILSTLERAYECPVDIEYAINFFEDQTYRINLLQCRRFPVKSIIQDIAPPADLDSEAIIFKTAGAIIGNSIAKTIDRIIYVVPEVYGAISDSERYSIARLIGKVNRLNQSQARFTILLGPGRWGTSTPSCGVPISFSEINRCSIICEIAEKIGKLIPDVSLGTHFFNNLVESEILYLVIYPDRPNYLINRNFFKQARNSLLELIPEADAWTHALKIIDFDANSSKSVAKIYMNAFTQQGICYTIINSQS